MATTTATPDDPDDPFAGYPPQPVACEWLSDRDEAAAPSADLIRLVVDDRRGITQPWANDVYQRYFLRQVQDFIGPTRAVLVTDAGAITARIGPTDATPASLDAGLAELGAALARTDVGKMEMLVGVDGCVSGQATHLQTVVHLHRQRHVSRANTTLKLYPNGPESQSLIGWQLCQAADCVPEELVATRRVQTSIGTVLVLVCHDAIIFSGRSQAMLKDGLKHAIRAHFLEQARAEPKPIYILLATHWQGTYTNEEGKRVKSGGTFRNAARYLADETGATVVTTMRTPREELAATAHRFDALGPRSEKVATLLVRDTFPSDPHDNA